MTAFTAARTSADQGAERKGPRKAVAFGLAGLIAAAGIAGTVVASSAYFTDTQTLANNSVKTNTVKLGLNGVGASTAAVPAALTNLVPAISATPASVSSLAKEQSFDVKNIGDGPFTWRLNVDTLRVTAADGTTVLPDPSTSTQLSIADAKAKLRYQIGYVSGGNTTWKAAKSFSDSDLSGDEYSGADVNSSAPNLAEGAVTTLKVRYWLDSNTSSATADNVAQNLRYTFNLKVEAQQPL